MAKCFEKNRFSKQKGFMVTKIEHYFMVSVDTKIFLSLEATTLICVIFTLVCGSISVETVSSPEPSNFNVFPRCASGKH